MNVKQQVEQVLQQLPDDCTMEEVQHQLYVSDLIRRRAEMSDTEQGIPHDQLLKRLATWRAKNSRLSGSPRPRKTSAKSTTSSVPNRKRTPTR